MGHPDTTTAPTTVEQLLSADLPMIHAIAGFVPRGNDELLPVLRSLLAIARVSPSCGPENVLLWRRLVLKHFDFTVDPTKRFNVEDTEMDDVAWEYLGMAQDENDADADADEDEDDDDDKHQSKVDARDLYLQIPTLRRRVTTQELDDFGNDPIVLEATRAWITAHGADRPSHMLNEHWHWWPRIGAFFRPSQYQFLSDIQAGTASIGTWPEDEDAYTLFCDLAMVHDRFRDFAQSLETQSDAFETQMKPCFMRAMHVGDATMDDKFLAFAHCGVLPMHWGGDLADVTPRWPEIDMQSPKNDQDDDDHDHDDEEEGEDDDEDETMVEEGGAFFPLSTAATRLQLEGLVRRYFDDWRCVRVRTSMCLGPVFHIGRSKLSGRWMGFVGEEQD